MILISFNTPPAFLHHHVGEPPLVFFAGNTLPASPLSDSLPREKEKERERFFLQNFNLYYFTRVQGMEIKFLGIHCTLRLEEILTCHAGRFDDGSCRQ